METPQEIIPQVGMPATIQLGSTMSPATIIEVSKSGKTVKLQRDRAVDRVAFGESPKIWETDPTARVETFSRRVLYFNGYAEIRWYPKGQSSARANESLHLNRTSPSPYMD